jgi:hypothetical protein
LLAGLVRAVHVVMAGILAEDRAWVPFIEMSIRSVHSARAVRIHLSA